MVEYNILSNSGNKEQMKKKTIFVFFVRYAGKYKLKMSSFKSNENIHKKEGGSHHVVSANKASSVTL